MSVFTAGVTPQELQEQILSEEDTFIEDSKLAQLNTDFNSDDYYKSQVDSEYDRYTKERQKAYDSGDYDTVRQWDEYYSALKGKRDFFSDSLTCTFDGTCDDSSQDIFNNPSSEWRYDQQIHNQELLKSLRRTFGSFNRRTGEQITDQQLIDMWMTDQAYNMTNITKLGIEAASIAGATPQQQKDLALQMLTYDKIKATGDGSREWWKQTFDVTTGLLTDPTTYGSLATFGIGLGVKEGAKAATKEGLKETIKKFLIKPYVKGAGIGAGYTGFDNLARQSIRTDAN